MYDIRLIEALRRSCINVIDKKISKLNKGCCIFNFAPHYRTAIFKQMDLELGCDFYFGNKLETEIKKLNYFELKGFKKEVENKRILRSSFTWQKGVVKLVFKREYRYFILTGDSSYISNLFIAFFALILNKKVYLWMHGLTRDLSFKEKVLTYPLYYMADKFLLYSDYSKEFMLKKGFRTSKIICIYNSLDFDLHMKVRRKLAQTNIYRSYFKNDFPVLIYIGRIQKIKKIDFIIDAMSILKEKGIFCNLVIVGSDSENTNIEEKICSSQLENNVWLYGSCYDESKIGELIYNAALCVSPGNIGLTAMHSFTYGTPAVTHNNFSNQMPEFEVIKSGVTGDFFEENNINDLSVKIQNWISIGKDKREVVRLATNLVIDEKYNPYYQVEILKSLISNTL